MPNYDAALRHRQPQRLLRLSTEPINDVEGQVKTSRRRGDTSELPGQTIKVQRGGRSPREQLSVIGRRSTGCYNRRVIASPDPRSFQTFRIDGNCLKYIERVRPSNRGSNVVCYLDCKPESRCQRWSAQEILLHNL